MAGIDRQTRGFKNQKTRSVKPLIRSHLSIAGGDYKTVDTTAAIGLDTFQLFTKGRPE